MKDNQKGLASIWIVLVLISVVAVGGVFFLTRSEKSLQPVSNNSSLVYF